MQTLRQARARFPDKRSVDSANPFPDKHVRLLSVKCVHLRSINLNNVAERLDRVTHSNSGAPQTRARLAIPQNKYLISYQSQPSVSSCKYSLENNNLEHLQKCIALFQHLIQRQRNQHILNIFCRLFEDRKTLQSNLSQ